MAEVSSACHCEVPSKPINQSRLDSSLCAGEVGDLRLRQARGGPFTAEEASRLSESCKIRSSKRALMLAIEPFPSSIGSDSAWRLKASARCRFRLSDLLGKALYCKKIGHRLCGGAVTAPPLLRGGRYVKGPCPLPRAPFTLGYLPPRPRSWAEGHM